MILYISQFHHFQIFLLNIVIYTRWTLLNFPLIFHSLCNPTIFKKNQKDVKNNTIRTRSFDQVWHKINKILEKQQKLNKMSKIEKYAWKTGLDGYITLHGYHFITSTFLINSKPTNNYNKYDCYSHNYYNSIFCIVWRRIRDDGNWTSHTHTFVIFFQNLLICYTFQNSCGV